MQINYYVTKVTVFIFRYNMSENMSILTNILMRVWIKVGILVSKIC
jgi:hypothetical protein